ncbi:hypothetical protein E4U34_007629 [Claviceps purpurea]|nr:hypothetical protein E4U34_007629 [Claviceps purpurea]
MPTCITTCRRRRVSQGLPVANPIDCFKTTIFCVAQVSGHVQSMRSDDNRYECIMPRSFKQAGVVNSNNSQLLPAARWHGRRIV